MGWRIRAGWLFVIVTTATLSACSRWGYVSNSVDARGADGPGADVRSVDLRPADGPGPDLRLVDLLPADGPTPDRQPADTRPADIPIPDLKPADTRPADKPIPDLKPADTRPADTQEPTRFLVNGDFSQGKTGWTESVFPGSGCSGNRTVSIVADPPYDHVVELRSTNALGCGGNAQVSQAVNIPTSGYTTFTLRAAVRVVSSNVVYTCGIWGGEVPVILIVDYTDTAAKVRSLKFSFYASTGAANETCANPQPETDVTWYPQKIAKDTWVQFTSPNLLPLVPAGSYITGLTVLAWGWDFVGRATNLSLEGTP